MTLFSQPYLFAVSAVAVVILSISTVCAAPTLVIKNNHEMPYKGPVTFSCDVQDGFYTGKKATGQITNNRAVVVVDLPARSEVKLTPVKDSADRLGTQLFSVAADSKGTTLSWNKAQIGTLDIGLFITDSEENFDPGKAAASFKPLQLNLSQQADGSFAGVSELEGFKVEAVLIPHTEGWLDVDIKLTRLEDSPKQEYIALIRKITTPGAKETKMRWNGRVVQGATEPEEINVDFKYTHGLDWCSWKAGDLSFTAANGFAPGFTVEKKPGQWIPRGAFYIWEYLRQTGDSINLVSEIYKPAPDKPEKDGTTTKYAAVPLKGEPAHLKWRLAVSKAPYANWEESQMLGYAGYKKVSSTSDAITVDLGAPYVEFGTSYFPYSTMCENFDFYRVTSLNMEGWWPFAPKMWENWRTFIPQMQTDFRIIRSMGFEWVRLHHMEMLGQMDRKNALDFLDFYMDECRKLGFKVMVDTSGTPAWFETIVGRYKDLVKRVEIENEILIPGIKPGDTERWTACYKAVKKASPETEAFLTGNCDQGIFERLIKLGVPFDRVGFHSYKHGPGYLETFKTLPLAVAGHAADLDSTPVLGEFNWKELTRWSPEARAKIFAEIYGNMLESRSVKDFVQFHWQETLSVNPSITRKGIRHYETIYLDRRPKPEAVEFMKLIRRYSRDESPFRQLPITINEVTIENGSAKAVFSIENTTGSQIKAKLSTESFGSIECKLLSDNTITIMPGGKAEGNIEVKLKQNSLPGTYHFFIKADYGSKAAYGWGVAANPGAPEFDSEPILPDHVVYPQGSQVVGKFDWNKPTCVAFGPDAEIVEMEMAYNIANTLQSATGRKIRLCSSKDITDEYLNRGNLILVGNPEGNPMVADQKPELTAGKGTVLLQESTDKRQVLLLTGEKPVDVEAAATDFVLRYWKNAKDSVIRVSGMEKGAALGNRAVLGELNPP